MNFLKNKIKIVKCKWSKVNIQYLPKIKKRSKLSIKNKTYRDDE
jgi:hypothetical protein